MQVVNWKMVSHPINWVVVVLMALIAGAFGHLMLAYLGHTPDTAESRKSSYDDMPAGQSPGQVAAGAIDPQGSYQT